MVNEEPNQPSLTFLMYYFRSHSLNLFLTVALKRLIHPSISNTQLSMSLITCCRSYHIDEYIQCFVCFRYWFIIIEMFYEVYFYFDLNLQQIVLESLHVWIINIFYSMFRVRFYLLRGLIYTSAMAVFFFINVHLSCKACLFCDISMPNCLWMSICFSNSSTPLY